MQVFNEIKSLRDILLQFKIEKKTIGLFPTMGALHLGHLELVKQSKKECDITVCSIYVNPKQFNKAIDLDKYPKTLDRDLELLTQVDCDIVFCPSTEEMYPKTNQINFDFGRLDKIMEGEFRPGHFSGVATVISKLFNIVQPDIAYFGQKDLQQFAVINRLVEELHFSTKLSCVPIVREDSGLAMSSRNMRLSESSKADALIIHRSLIEAKEALIKGVRISDIKNKIKAKFASSIVELEYFEVVNTETLEALENITDNNHVALCVAGYAENVRLIDNMLLNE